MSIMEDMALAKLEGRMTGIRDERMRIIQFLFDEGIIRGVSEGFVAATVLNLKYIALDEHLGGAHFNE